jgi:hypothetical protein
MAYRVAYIIIEAGLAWDKEHWIGFSAGCGTMNATEI